MSVSEAQNWIRSGLVIERPRQGGLCLTEFKYLGVALTLPPSTFRNTHKLQLLVLSIVADEMLKVKLAELGETLTKLLWCCIGKNIKVGCIVLSFAKGGVDCILLPIITAFISSCADATALKRKCKLLEVKLEMDHNEQMFELLMERSADIRLEGCKIVVTVNKRSEIIQRVEIE